MIRKAGILTLILLMYLLSLKQLIRSFTSFYLQTHLQSYNLKKQLNLQKTDGTFSVNWL